jgi:HupE / UreJ protein
MTRSAGRFLLWFLGFIWAIPVSAHSMPNSVVNIDLGASAVRVEVMLPANELRLAYGEEIRDRGNSLTPELSRSLERYLAAHIKVTDVRGQRLVLSGLTVWIENCAPFDQVAARMTFSRDGTGIHTFVLHDEAITHVVMSHIIAVYLRGNDQGGGLDAPPELIGMLQNPQSEVPFVEGTPVQQGHFAEAFKIGVRHISEGFDHLLFILTLLIPAPFIAAGGRWSSLRNSTATFRHLAVVVTAFTLGHSVTLMLGVLLDWQLPWAWVEVGIALSVFVAAVQAWRPIIGNREPLMAGTFGLIHGMAFSAVIGRQLIDPWVKFEAVLAFNLGIEAVQLALVVAIAPLLNLFARTRQYHVFRAFCALVIGLVAANWIAERLRQLGDASGSSTIALLGGSAAMLTVAAIAIAVAIPLGRRANGAEPSAPQLN